MEKKLLDPTLTNVGLLKPVHPDVDEYLLGLLSRHGQPVLTEMEEYAHAKNFPIVGRNVGVFLEVMARTIGARRIFEFGSGFGYSAYWFCSSFIAGGVVLCTDADFNNSLLAKDYLSRLDVWKHVDYRVGWGQQVFEGENGEFDLIYNDADKSDYPLIWQLARRRIRPGGLYIADNCLWGGRVTRDVVLEDVVPGFTEGVKEHNRMISEDKDFDFFINPIRDGVLVARRK